MGVIVAVLLAGLHGIGDFSLSEEERRQRFAEAGVSPVRERVDGVEWVRTGEVEAPVVLFIHGSPGGWDNFIAYLTHAELRKRARVISLSRPGYGSGMRGEPVFSLKRQAEAAARVLETHGPAVVVGHSLGGPIAARLAMDSPELVKSLLLLAPAVDPDLERVGWWQRVGALPGAWALLPDTVDVCNRELIPLEDELRRMEPGWGGLKVPVTVIHGGRDRLVPVENVDFLEKRVSPDLLRVKRLPDANHFIPWTEETKIVDEILVLAEDICVTGY